MKRASRVGVLVGLALTAATALSACSSASDQSAKSAVASPAPASSQLSSASPTSSTGGALAGPTLILDGLLETEVGERVIQDSVNKYQARGVISLQAATRSANNPLSNYRTQLLGNGWKLSVDESNRIAAQRKGDWISLTTTQLESFTGNLPWATVFAYAELTAEEPEL